MRDSFTATTESPSTFPATVSTPVPAPTFVGIISMPSHPASPALRRHGVINTEGTLLVTYDRTRLSLDEVVEALREELGPIEYAVETMPEATR